MIDKWFKENFDYSKQKVFTFVGFTYGEDRVGMITEEEEVESVYPFIQLKMGVKEVFGLLDATIGISGSYKTKSRSGCFCCPFLRRYEKSMMLFDRYDEFQKSKSYEKLSNSDGERFNLSNEPILHESLYSNNSIGLSGPQHYFVPASVDVRTEFKGHSERPKTLKLKDKLAKDNLSNQMNIFDVVDGLEDNVQQGYIYVAVGMWTSTIGRDYLSDMSYSGLYRTEFSTFSKSLTGLKRSLHFWVEHKLEVASLYQMTKAEMRKDLKIALYQIKVDKSILNILQEPEPESYTWSASESYAQMETLTRLIHSVLTYEGWVQYWDLHYKSKDNIPMDELWFSNGNAHYIKSQIKKFAPLFNNLNSSISWSGIFPLPSIDEIGDMTMESIRSKANSEFKMSSAQSCAICSL